MNILGTSEEVFSAIFKPKFYNTIVRTKKQHASSEVGKVKNDCFLLKEGREFHWYMNFIILNGVRTGCESLTPKVLIDIQWNNENDLIHVFANKKLSFLSLSNAFVCQMGSTNAYSLYFRVSSIAPWYNQELPWHSQSKQLQQENNPSMGYSYSTCMNESNYVEH